MTDRLPPSLAKRAARNQHEAESRLLDHFQVMRDVRLAILWPGTGDPDLDTWIIAAEEVGLTVALAIQGSVATFSKNGEPQFIGFDIVEGAMITILP